MTRLFSSAEVRWFREGTAPAAVGAWVRSGGHPRDMPERTDRYLVLPGCPTVGVKIREGGFEIKARTSSPQPVIYAAGVRGRRDTWIKWSREIGGIGDLTRGPPGAEPSCLDAAADHLLRADLDVALDEDASMSYPEWLNIL